MHHKHGRADRTERSPNSEELAYTSNSEMVLFCTYEHLRHGAAEITARAHVHKNLEAQRTCRRSGATPRPDAMTLGMGSKLDVTFDTKDTADAAVIELCCGANVG